MKKNHTKKKTQALSLLNKAIKDPTKALKRIHNILVSPIRRLIDGLFAPLYEIKRAKLLESESKEWTTVRTDLMETKDLNFDSLVGYLSEQQKHLVDWSDINQNHKDNPKKNKVSIIVLILNNKEMTLRCLDSIYKAKTDINYEVIAVDNGSNYSTIRALRKYKSKRPELRLVHIDKNLNFSLGNNVGFTFAQGNLSVFLNNDTYVTNGWLDELIKPLKNPRIGAVQPVLLYPDNTIQSAGIVFSNKSNLGYGIYVGKGFRSVVANRSRKVQAVTGACLAIRSSDFAKLRGFDVGFVNGQEDVDICLRLLQGGGRKYNYVTSNSRVYHDEGKTPGRGRRVAFNRKVFVDRWKGKIKPDDTLYYESDGYQVKHWVVDLEDYKDEKIEIYTPTLRKKAR